MSLDLAPAFAMVILAFFRLAPLLLIVPILHYSRLPLTVRLVVTLALSILLASASPSIANPDDITVMQLARELCLGAVLAFAFHSLMAAIQLAGRLLDLQMGFSAAGVFNPATAETDGLMSEVLTVTVFLLFLSADLHSSLLLGFASVMQWIPLGQVEFPLMQLIVKQFGVIYAGGLLLAAPLVIFLWLTDVALALASRSMPQANIYFVALPIKIGLGLFVLMLILNTGMDRFLALIQIAFSSWDVWLQGGKP